MASPATTEKSVHTGVNVGKIRCCWSGIMLSFLSKQPPKRSLRKELPRWLLGRQPAKQARRVGEVSRPQMHLEPSALRLPTCANASAPNPKELRSSSPP